MKINIGEESNKQYKQICINRIRQQMRMEYKNKASFFVNKGYISTPFKVRSNLLYVLKLKQKQIIPDGHPQIHSAANTCKLKTQYPHTKNNSYQSLRLKPSTAPERADHNRNIHERQSHQPNIFIQDQSPVNAENQDDLNRYSASNFKSTILTKKQLLFLKPYLRYRNQSMTVEQNKTEIYNQISKGESHLKQVNNKHGIIEYMTEYREPVYSAREKQAQNNYQKQIFVRQKRKNHCSINVLREKLKNKCHVSIYREKINTMKYD